MNDLDECSICLEPLTSFKLYTLECKHVFHKDCIYEWSLKSNLCPICNQSFTYKNTQIKTSETKNIGALVKKNCLTCTIS